MSSNSLEINVIMHPSLIQDASGSLSRYAVIVEPIVVGPTTILRVDESGDFDLKGGLYGVAPELDVESFSAEALNISSAGYRKIVVGALCNLRPTCAVLAGDTELSVLDIVCLPFKDEVALDSLWFAGAMAGILVDECEIADRGAWLNEAAGVVQAFSPVFGAAENVFSSARRLGVIEDEKSLAILMSRACDIDSVGTVCELNCSHDDGRVVARAFQR